CEDDESAQCDLGSALRHHVGQDTSNYSDSLLGFHHMPTRRHATALHPRKQPLQARSRETVRVILRAAAQVFGSRGYAASTTNHIAERAGVSIGSLYEYFPNKDALLHALLEDHIQEAQAILTAVTPDAGRGSDGLADVVRQYIGAMVALHARDR